MRAMIILFCLLFSGCSLFQKQPVPMVPDFPQPYSTEKCKQLMTIEGDQVPMTDVLKVIVENYKLYYYCSDMVDGWNDWYKQQRDVYEKLGKDKK
jgi:hypothetical protein